MQAEPETSNLEPRTGNPADDAGIRVRDLVKRFARDGDEVEILRGLSFEVGAGELVAVVGPSGAGKSTLLHLLGGLERPTAGEIWYGPVALQGMSAEELAAFRNRHVGFVFQFHHLLPEFTALENVMLPLLIRRDPSAGARRHAEGLLGRVGLGHRLAHRPGELSGGEQQRVALARALVGGPQVLLADEPTGNLDSKTGEEVFELVRELNHERRLTCLLVTHNEGMANRADRIVHMLDGRLVRG